MPRRRDAEARAQIKYVQTADPESPVAIVGLAVMERFTGHPERAVRLIEPRLDEFRTLEPAIEILSKSYVQERKSKQAVELLRSMPVASESADSRAAHLGIAYAASGETRKATEILQGLIRKVHAGQPLAYETARYTVPSATARRLR